MYVTTFASVSDGPSAALDGRVGFLTVKCSGVASGFDFNSSVRLQWRKLSISMVAQYGSTVW